MCVKFQYCIVGVALVELFLSTGWLFVSAGKPTVCTFNLPLLEKTMARCFSRTLWYCTTMLLFGLDLSIIEPN